MSGDVPAALMLLNEILEKGFDTHNFLGGLSAHMRDLLVCRDPVTLELLEVGAGIRDRYQEQSKSTTQEWLYRVLEILGGADISFKASRNQRLHLELTLLKACNLADGNKKKVLTEAVPEETGSVETENAGASDESPPDKKRAAQADQPSENSQKDSPKVGQGSLTPKAEPAKPRISTGNIPSIKDALNGTVQKEKENTDEPALNEDPVQLSESFSHDDLLEQWYAYADKIRIETPRMASSLKHHLPALKEDLKIEVIWSNTIQMEQFNKEVKPGLLSFLESSLKNSSISIQAVLSEKEEKQNTLYTSEEKFKHMTKKNPNLVKLKERFNLDFE